VSVVKYLPNNSKVFWKQETKGSKLDSQKKFEDTKGVIRIRTSKKDRQYNGQKKKALRWQFFYMKHS
jgi:hypothetical protein